VFASRLNRRKFAKNAIDLIRCKFSIDGGFRGETPLGARPHFRNHNGCLPETPRSPSALNEQACGARKPREVAVFRRRAAHLSVRLISL
jgi:hypothetical protein